MTIRTWSFYRESDGLFLGREFSAPSDQFLAQNTPKGCVAIEGRYARERQRVDLLTRRVIDDPVFERQNSEKRIQGMRGDLARARIDELELKQLRPQRELEVLRRRRESVVSKPDGDRNEIDAIDSKIAEAQQRLTELDQQIAVLRSDLQ